MSEQAPTEHYNHPIKRFLNDFFSSTEFREKYQKQVNISAPIPKDMEAVRSGDFAIRSIEIREDEKNISGGSIHFYVGQTEFHMWGDAAENILSDSLHVTELYDNYP